MSEEVTMWSESLYDSLYVALRRNKPDSIVKGILSELTGKGHSADKIIQMVRDNVSPGAVSRVKRLLGVPLSGSSDSGGRAGRSRKSKSNTGFVAWLKSIFK